MVRSESFLRTVHAVTVSTLIKCFFCLGIGDSGHHTPDFGAKRNQERSTGPSTGSHLYSGIRRILVSSGCSMVADPHYFWKPEQDPHLSVKLDPGQGPHKSQNS
jgi:hypothetical protein